MLEPPSSNQLLNVVPTINLKQLDNEEANDKHFEPLLYT